MATYTDQELLFLSNLMHMRNENIYDKENNKIMNPFNDIWTEKNVKGNVKIGAIINKIDTDELRNNKYLKDYKFDGEISGSEWADMIDAMKQSDICDLKIQDYKVDDKKALSAYLTDNEGKAYVVFRGTSSGEWYDNFLGGFLTDTEQQLRALDYINSINADHITVVGHSKGGNKAKYVALLSDKVDRCVSFDGQGFSQFFMEKYQDLIEKNKDKITCYALDGDFVNILLYDIYNSKYYIKANGVASFEQNHSPNSFFQFSYDKDGNVNGYDLTKTEQITEIASLHLFVNYISATVPESERKDLFSYIGNIVAMALGKKPPDYIDKYNSEELINYISAKENAHELALLISYIIEYEEYDNGITEAIGEILDQLGMSDITKWVKRLDKWIGTENVLKFVLSHPDKVSWLLKKFKAPGYIIDLLNNTAAEYESVKDEVHEVTAESIQEYNIYANDNIRDYTQAKRDRLLSLTDAVNNEKPYDVKKWDILYRFEDWFGLLDIDHYQNNIDTYYRKVIDINDMSNQQLQLIFHNVDSVVKRYKCNIETEINNLKTISNKLIQL